MYASTSLLWAIAVAVTAFAGAAAPVLALAGLAGWTAANDSAIATPDPAVVLRRGMRRSVLAHERWWTVIVGLAGARLLGDGVPLWIVVAFALGLGVLDEVTRGRVVLIVAIPAAIAVSFLLARGTGCLTGFGATGHAIVPVAVAGTLLVMAARRDRVTFAAKKRWRPEVVALAVVLVVEWLAVPWRAVLSLQASPQRGWLIAITVGTAVVVSALAGRSGHAVAGLAAGLIVMQVALVSGPRLCAGQSATTLVAVAGTVVGATLAAAVRTRIE